MAWPRGVPRVTTPEQAEQHRLTSQKGGRVRTTPDYMIEKLAQATLTDDQRLRVAQVLMRDTDEPEAAR